MAYDIYISGNQEPLRIEHGGDALVERWKLLKMKKIADEPAKIGGWIGVLSAIKSFRPIDRSRSDSNSVAKDSENEYRRELASLRALPPEKRAKRMGFFRLVYWGFTQKRCDGTDIERKAEEIQKRFFEQNPKRIFCDVMEFKELIPEAGCNPSVLTIIENQIRQDTFAVKFL